jgi:hypothetical protein
MSGCHTRQYRSCSQANTAAVAQATQEADAFRRRLLAAGVLTGTLALGAAAGIGWANMTAQDFGTGKEVQADEGGSSSQNGTRLPTDFGVRPE